jgi:hypothetical protein
VATREMNSILKRSLLVQKKKLYELASKDTNLAGVYIEEVVYF